MPLCCYSIWLSLAVSVCIQFVCRGSSQLEVALGLSVLICLPAGEGHGPVQSSNAIGCQLGYNECPEVSPLNPAPIKIAATVGENSCQVALSPFTLLDKKKKSMDRRYGISFLWKVLLLSKLIRHHSALYFVEGGREEHLGSWLGGWVHEVGGCVLGMFASCALVPGELSPCLGPGLCAGPFCSSPRLCTRCCQN